MGRRTERSGTREDRGGAGADGARGPAGAGVLGGLHDLGKITPPFQAQVPEAAHRSRKVCWASATVDHEPGHRRFVKVPLDGGGPARAIRTQAWAVTPVLPARVAYRVQPKVWSAPAQAEGPGILTCSPNCGNGWSNRPGSTSLLAIPMASTHGPAAAEQTKTHLSGNTSARVHAGQKGIGRRRRTRRRTHEQRIQPRRRPPYDCPVRRPRRG
nr:HD domain-containing protein [Streptomyces sp. STR69]